MNDEVPASLRSRRRWPRPATVAVVCLALSSAMVGCRRAADRRPAADTSRAAASRTDGAAIFVDRAVESGLDFTHFNGMTGDWDYPEMMGGGGAMLDYDGDGDLDLYLVQGSLLSPDHRLEDALFPPRHPQPFSDRLYRNDSRQPVAAGPGLHFEDVTAAAALRPTGYGMGIAVGDFDGDGLPDLYRTAFGANQLLRNRGGRFIDVTADSSADDPRWSVPAVFFDYDRDGRLDLYVGNYLDLTPGTRQVCRDAAGALDYCGPAAYHGVTDRLFRNRGDGSFEDVSATSGIGAQAGKAMGAVAVDFDADGWLDLYVANDGEPNFLWINQRDGTFEDQALWRGCAVSADGLPQASMGVDAGDFDNDGDLDLFMTHLTGEPNTLFRNDGGGTFTDISSAAGLSVPSWSLTSFGTGWLDVENDGDLDLLTLSGAVKKIEALAQQGDPYPLHQKLQLYRNLGDGRFEEIGDGAGEPFARSEVGRGAAFGDVDNDGDVDVLVCNSNGSARLLVNEAGSAAPWLGFRLVEAATGGELVGATLEVLGPRAARHLARFGADGSYASGNDPRVLLGATQAQAGMRYRLRPTHGLGLAVDRLVPRHYYVLAAAVERHE